jgi:hypothetical protein
MPRPLAPHTEVAVPEPDESRVGPKSKHVAPSPQAVPLHARPLPEKERNVSRYPPLAQANTPMAPGPVFHEDYTRARPHAGLPPRTQGPRMGYFAEEKREIPSAVLPHTTTRPQDAPISARQTPVPAPEMTHMEPLHSQGFRTPGMEVHGSPLLPTQQPYMQHQPQPSLMSTTSHSRQPSLTKPPSSPAQQMQKQDQDISPIRHDHVSQRSFYPLPGQHMGIHQPPVLSPPKESPRSAVPANEPEAPRQVPAKRSNILSILNDEPEEPQPRKRFASDQASSNPVGTAASPSRPVYTGGHSFSQTAAAPPRQEETHLVMPAHKASVYVQQNQYLPPSRNYSDYQSYAPIPGSLGAPANNDWMARFDPRGQQQQPPPPHQPSSRSSGTLAPQPPYSPYSSGQSLSGHSLPNLTAPSPAPTPSPAPSQRHSYHTSIYAPSPVVHAQAAAIGSRDLNSQNQVFRQTIGSPTQRTNTIAYGARQGPPTPIQSPANLLGIASRTPTTASYASPASVTPAPTHVSVQQHPSGHQTYQQHVQTMVSGSHQQPAHRSALGLAAAQYGHNTPPPQAQPSRTAGLPGPPHHQAMSMGRSYTPPAILQPNQAGGLSYAPGGPSPVVGAVHPLQARPSVPGSLGEAVPGPHGVSGHHRVYSQGSNAGSLPGQMTPQHQPR